MRVGLSQDMFFGAAAFNGDISKWDVGRVTSMACMFSRAKAFNGDVSKWDVEKVIDMAVSRTHTAAIHGPTRQPT